MFKEFFSKFATFESHHQALFAVLIGVAIILCTWGIEQLLEIHIVKKKRVFDYCSVILIGLLILVITKYAVTTVM